MVSDFTDVKSEVLKISFRVSESVCVWMFRLFKIFDLSWFNVDVFLLDRFETFSIKCVSMNQLKFLWGTNEKEFYVQCQRGC